MFFYSLDKVLERISICPLLSEGCAVSYCSEMAQSKSILHTFIPASHFLLLGLNGREKHEPNITNQLLARSNVFRKTPLALVNFILFQSAASWTWSHTCLSVPCIAPASSAAHRFVFWVHSLPGTRTEAGNKQGEKDYYSLSHMQRIDTCMSGKPSQRASKVARRKCNEISTRSKSSIRPSFFSRSEFLLFSRAVSFSKVRSD